MNNPNESILLTEDGHPIGDIVVADNSALAPVLDNREVAEGTREEQMRAVAAELMGEPGADAAIAEWFPGYGDGERRKRAMAMFIAGGRNVEEIAKAVDVPGRTVAQWLYVGQWDRIVKQELAARHAASTVELGRLRAERRARVAREQLEAAKTIRDTALEQLGAGEVSVKSAAEAVKSSADVEARILGVSESGALTGVDEESGKAEQNGKTPLVMVFQGGLPPVRKATT